MMSLMIWKCFQMSQRLDIYLLLINPEAFFGFIATISEFIWFFELFYKLFICLRFLDFLYK